ncbi:MAG: Ig-like domain-containing protein [Planctomycetota bacterium]
MLRTAYPASFGAPVRAALALALVAAACSSSDGDATAPVLAVTSHVDGDVVQGVTEITLAGTVSDEGELAAVEVSVGGGAFEAADVSAGTYSIQVPVALARTSLEVRARDAAGNAATVALDVLRTAEGRLDTSFGPDVLPADGTPDGYAFSDRANQNDTIRDGLVDASGRTLACGLSRGAAGNFDFIVWCYTADGQLDATFGPDVEPMDGTPDGFVTLDGPTGGTNSNDWAHGIVLDAAGNILITGYGDGVGTGQDLVLVRFTPDGLLDTTFGADVSPADGTPDGFVVYTSTGDHDDRGHALVVADDGSIFVAGRSDATLAQSCLLLKFDANGALDASFGGGDGIAMVSDSIGGGADDEANAVELDAEGRILVAGASNGRPVVWRFTADGTLDTTFGVDAYPADGTPDGFFAGAGMNGGAMHDVLVQGDGSLLATGQYLVDSTNRWDMVLFRTTPDGAADLAFGSDYDATPGPDGYVRHHAAAGNTNSDGGKELAVDVAGNILVAGDSEGMSSAPYMTVWRFTPDGTLDATFGGDLNPMDGAPDGFVFDAGPSNNSNLNQGEAILLDAEGRITVVGTTYNGALGGANCAVWRLL